MIETDGSCVILYMVLVGRLTVRTCLVLRLDFSLQFPVRITPESHICGQGLYLVVSERSLSARVEVLQVCDCPEKEPWNLSQRHSKIRYLEYMVARIRPRWSASIGTFGLYEYIPRLDVPDICQDTVD